MDSRRNLPDSEYLCSIVQQRTSRSVFWALALWLMASLAAADELKMFTSDGCSVFPDGTPEQQSLWLDCCVEHDLAYWRGGTKAQKKQADERLHQCVADIGKPDIANLMLAGVKVGGSPFLPTGYRWGYGWPYPRGYQELTQEELAQVENQLDRFQLLLKTLRSHTSKPD